MNALATPAPAPEYPRDYTGHYPLAIAHFLDKANTSGDGETLASLGRYALTPLGDYRPLPQARKFHQSDARFRWCLGGNRSSKSHALAVETLWIATGLHPWKYVAGPTYGWYCTTTWDEVGKTLYQEKLRHLLVGIEHEIIWHNKQRETPFEIRVRFRNSELWSRIAFKAYEQGREIFQAASLAYGHFDEQFDQSIFVEAITRIGPGNPMNFAAAMTPIIPQPWLEERLTGEPHPGDAIFEYPIDDNRISAGGFIEDEKIDALITEWPPEVRPTRRSGKWGSYLGAIFQTFSRDVHVVSAARELELFFKGDRRAGKVPYALRSTGSIDWGGSNPFVFLWAVRIPHLDDEWYVYDELYWDFKGRGERRLDQFAEDVKARTLEWGTMLDHCWADHDATNTVMFAHYGIPSRPANKDVDLGIETVRSRLNPREFLADEHWPRGRPRVHIAERCKNLLRELPSYKWREATPKAKEDPKPVPLKKDDHTVDALRYLLHSELVYDNRPRKIVTLGAANRRAF